MTDATGTSVAKYRTINRAAIEQGADALLNWANMSDEYALEAARVVLEATGHATRNRVPTLDQIVRALRDKDCPYLGNYKLGYDAALDDVLDEVRRAT